MPAQRRISEAQLEELLAWMELHPKQAKNCQLNCAQAKTASHKLWEELASRLNALGSGASKTWKEWRQMGLDEPVVEPPVVVEPYEAQPLQTSLEVCPEIPLINEPSTSQNVHSPYPSKRKHTASAKTEEFSPMEKSRRMGPPQWALDLEERRLALDAERLEEDRHFHRSLLEQQQKFQTELLSALKELVQAVRFERPLDE